MNKIKEFFMKIFCRKQKLRIESPKQQSKFVEKDNFKDYVRLEKNRLELIELQNKFENNQLDLKSLSKKQIQELIDLYKEQVKELNYKLGTTGNSEI